ncbi:SDR family NAD(P)-dependent oxidoreductase [Virgifigura deserti]|uniref:SDR family NAD(P)-dependent oxidoreductase n=1 Tax=Virgifigura deserti TaxID=2268457 RepID=UPI003CCBE13F
MAENPFDLSGHAALVTGASSGLGRRFALTLARAGAKVALAARRGDRLADVAREIEAFDGRAFPVILNVTDPVSVRDAVAAAETELGAITILVNNAGVAGAKPMLEQDEADWDRVIDTNLKGAWLVAQEVARHMIRLGHGGSIVNIASILGLRAASQVAAYGASKAGLIHLTRSMAVELARHDIRVNAIAPGYFDTELNHEFLSSTAGQAMLKSIPQRRFGRPEDLDGALLLLASDASAYMTGGVITVDGGHSVGL